MRSKLLTQSCMICNMAFLFYFFCITEHLYLKITDTHWKYSLTANFFCFWYLTGVKKLQRTCCILKIRRLYTVHLLIWREEKNWLQRKTLVSLTEDSCGEKQTCWTGQEGYYVTAGTREDEVWMQLGPGYPLTETTNLTSSELLSRSALKLKKILMKPLVKCLLE